ncbi:hypothetical protein IIK_02403 [Bacillus cereus VD102]|nr:hypothetical protein IIK_02403 [Bacillus cereus VD102]
MKTFFKIIGIIAGMAVIGVGLTYDMLYYLNNSKPAAKKHHPLLWQQKCWLIVM